MANTKIFGHLLDELNDGVTVFREGAGKPMPLTSTHIDVNVMAGLAVVVTTRLFSNAEDVPIEAILTMPVGFNAVVTGLVARIDGREFRAVAKAKEEARETYEEAINQGKTSILHEEALRGIHVLSIGQLAPGKEVSVELRIVVPLSVSETGPFLRIPMTAGQLYGASPLQPADDLITDAHVNHEATVTIQADTGIPRALGLGPVSSDAAIDITLDRAIEVIIESGSFGTVIGASADGQQVRIDLSPQATTEDHLRLGILVDRSGSTKGTIGDGTQTVSSAMRNGLTEALSGLSDEDHISLWQFSDKCERLGTGRGAEILQILKTLDKPSGGTNLRDAIRKVALSGIRDILVLTDGQIWGNISELATELDIRISAVLVGKASLDVNIGHLCALTGGDLFYAPEADVGPCVRLAMNGKRSSAIMREIELSEGLPVRVKRIWGGVEIAATWSEAMEIAKSSDIGRFAAGLCLGQMEEKAAAALALKEGLCTQSTSLVLVDDAGEASTGISETRKVPLMEEAASSRPITRLAVRSTSQAGTSSSHEPSVRFLLREEPTTMTTSERIKARIPSPETLIRLRAEKKNRPDMNSTKILQFLRDELDLEAQSLVAFDLEYLAKLAVAIDWDSQVNRVLSGDFTGLMLPERGILDIFASDEVIAGVLKNTPLPEKLVLLAWLAQRFVTHSRAAHRLASKVFGQITDGNFAAEIERQIEALKAKGK